MIVFVSLVLSLCSAHPTLSEESQQILKNPAPALPIAAPLSDCLVECQGDNESSDSVMHFLKKSRLSNYRKWLEKLPSPKKNSLVYGQDCDDELLASLALKHPSNVYTVGFPEIAYQALTTKNYPIRIIEINTKEGIKLFKHAHSPALKFAEPSGAKNQPPVVIIPPKSICSSNTIFSNNPAIKEYSSTPTLPAELSVETTAIVTRNVKVNLSLQPHTLDTYSLIISRPQRNSKGEVSHQNREIKNFVPVLAFKKGWTIVDSQPLFEKLCNSPISYGPLLHKSIILITSEPSSSIIPSHNDTYDPEIHQIEEQVKRSSEKNLSFFIASSKKSLKILQDFEDFEAWGKQELNLSHLSFYNISGLQEFTFLKSIDLSYNYIKSLNGLEKLANLITLNLCNNQITNIQPLATLNLGKLYLSNNNIVDLIPLQNQTKMIVLDLSNNSLHSLNGLEGAISLRELNISNEKLSLKAGGKIVYNPQANNQISDLSPLQNSRFLRKISVNNNPICNLLPLQNILKLNVINAREIDKNVCQQFKNIRPDCNVYQSPL